MMTSGGSDDIAMAFVVLLTMANLVLTGVLHYSIGLRLEAKGAES